MRKEITIRHQIQNKIVYAPLNLIPPNVQVVEQGKYPNPIKEKKPMGKEITLRYQIESKFIDAPVYPIVTNGKVA